MPDPMHPSCEPDLPDPGQPEYSRERRVGRVGSTGRSTGPHLRSHRVPKPCPACERQLPPRRYLGTSMGRDYVRCLVHDALVRATGDCRGYGEVVEALRPVVDLLDRMSTVVGAVEDLADGYDGAGWRGVADDIRQITRRLDQ